MPPRCLVSRVPAHRPACLTAPLPACLPTRLAGARSNRSVAPKCPRLFCLLVFYTVVPLHSLVPIYDPLPSATAPLRPFVSTQLNFSTRHTKSAKVSPAPLDGAEDHSDAPSRLPPAPPRERRSPESYFVEVTSLKGTEGHALTSSYYRHSQGYG